MKNLELEINTSWQIQINTYGNNPAPLPLCEAINGEIQDAPVFYDEISNFKMINDFYPLFASLERDTQKKAVHLKTDRAIRYFDFRDNFYAVWTTREIPKSGIIEDSKVGGYWGREREYLHSICNYFDKIFQPFVDENENFVMTSRNSGKLVDNFFSFLGIEFMEAYEQRINPRTPIRVKFATTDKPLSYPKKRKWNVYVVRNDGIPSISYKANNEKINLDNSLSPDKLLFCGLLEQIYSFIQGTEGDRIRHIKFGDSVVLFHDINYNNEIKEKINERCSTAGMEIRFLNSLSSLLDGKTEEWLLNEIKQDCERTKMKKASLTTLLKTPPKFIVIDASYSDNGHFVGELVGDEREATTSLARLIESGETTDNLISPIEGLIHEYLIK